MESEQTKQCLYYINKYERLIYKFAFSTHAKCKKLEIEEIKQNLIMRLIIAMKKFDQNFQEGEMNYIYTTLQNECSNMVRGYYSTKNLANAMSISLENTFEDLNGNLMEESLQYLNDSDNYYYSPESIFNNNEMVGKLENIIANLQEKERNIFYLYTSGVSVEEIANKYHTSRKNIYNRLSKIRENVLK